MIILFLQIVVKSRLINLKTDLLLIYKVVEFGLIMYKWLTSLVFYLTVLAESAPLISARDYLTNRKTVAPILPALKNIKCLLQPSRIQSF